MDFKEYTKLASRTAIYPGRNTIDGLGYVTSGLAGELGEIFEVVKKVQRDNNGEFTPRTISRISAEASDCYWYISQILHEIEYDFGGVNCDTDQERVYEDFKRVFSEDQNFFSRVRFLLISMHRNVGEILTLFATIEDNPSTEKECHLELLEHLRCFYATLMILLAHFDLKVNDVLQYNLDKLQERQRHNKLSGSGETIDER